VSGRPRRQGRRKKRLAADGQLHWLIRLSLALGRTPTELAEVLTAGDLALYQAAAEIDGPWWGEGIAAHLRQLCSVTAAASGASIPPDDFAIEWTVGGEDREARPAANLLPPVDGLEIFAARYGLDLVEVKPNG
jgi:hypothetical protein